MNEQLLFVLAFNVVVDNEIYHKKIVPLASPPFSLVLNFNPLFSSFYWYLSILICILSCFIDELTNKL